MLIQRFGKGNHNLKNNKQQNSLTKFSLQISRLKQLRRVLITATSIQILNYTIYLKLETELKN